MEKELYLSVCHVMWRARFLVFCPIFPSGFGKKSQEPDHGSNARILFTGFAISAKCAESVKPDKSAKLAKPSASAKSAESAASPKSAESAKSAKLAKPDDG